jgi:arginine-tRNA-protein transferase
MPIRDEKEQDFKPLEKGGLCRVTQASSERDDGMTEAERIFKIAEAHETVTYPCPYFNDGRETTLEVIRPSLDQFMQFHDLLAKGFRRTGSLFYMNACKDCAECISIRVPVRDFVPSKSQRRTLKANRDLKVAVSHFSEPSDVDLKVKFELFRKYMVGKHDNAENAEWMEFYSLHHGYPFTSEMHFYLEGKLVAVSVLDEGRDAVSSNYFYYDPDYPERRLGIFSILQEIAYAKSAGKEYYYLGFYIEKCRKMSYKADIRPNQILEGGLWRPFRKI